jgi:integrase
LKSASYLQRNRFGIFQFRRAVPEPLRPVVGKREIIQSLHTREPRDAIRLARYYANFTDRWFDQLQGTMTDETFKTEYGFELTLPDGTQFKQEISPDDIRAMKEAGLSPPQILDAMKHAATPPTLLASQPMSSTERPIGPTLAALIERFNDDRRGRKGQGWAVPDGDATKFRRLVEILGDVPCTNVTRDTSRNIRDTLSRLPDNTAPYRGQTVPEIVAIKHDATLSAKSVKGHIDLYCGLFKWAKRERLYTDENPFEDMAPVDKTPRHTKRDPFTPDELTLIFNGPMFSAFNMCKDKPHHYWAPLIALHTGARTAEIAALEATDIKTEIDDHSGKSVHVFSINTTDDEGRKRLKTEHAKRTVPIHDTLIELGLLAYRDFVQAAGHKRLFDYLPWDDKNGYGRYIGDDFTRYLKQLGIHQRVRKVFYSFRHTLATALERAEVPIHRIEKISGRSTNSFKSVGEQHYITPAKAVELHKDLMKVSFTKHLTKVKPFFDMIDRQRLSVRLRTL